MSVDKANSFMHGYEVRSAFSDKADKASMKAQSFSVFGLHIPKGPFKDKKAMERIEKSREMANQMLQDMMDSLAKVFQPKQ